MKIVAGTRPYAGPEMPREISKAASSLTFVRPPTGLTLPGIAVRFRNYRGWAISGLGGEQLLLDDHANPRLLSRILEGISGIEILGAAPERSRSQETLEKYGLYPPKDTLQWTLNNGTKNRRDTPLAEEWRTGEIQLGKSLPADPSRRFARFPHLDPDGVYVVRGSLVSLLARVEKFEDFREHNLLTWDPDRIDDLLVKKEDRTLWFAERHGDQWLNEKKSNLTATTEPLVDAWVKSEIQRFVDDPSEADRIRREILKHPTHQMIARDRKGNPVKLTIAQVQSKGKTLWVGQASNRGTAVFELDPKSAVEIQKQTLNKK
jgi:hypothetical protein